jgi:UDP-N-acetylmuramate--alanine ligase
MSYYHFIAIGGAGMSGIARILLELGHQISGSDIKASENTRRLQAMGAKVAIGHAREHVPEEAEVVVVSSAIHEDNPEVLEARRRGLFVVHRADMLALLLNQGKGIAIAGAHGKTTTTSMIAMVLEHAGLDPMVLVGGEVSDFGGNAKMGRGGYVVAEADESDGSFLKLQPYVSVITNVDDDHLDYYKNLDNVKSAFTSFMQRTKPGGTVVYCADDENARSIVPGGAPGYVSYGLSPGTDVAAEDVRRRGWGSTFRAVAAGHVLGTVLLQVPGIHNVQNALAAISVGRVLDVDFESISSGLGAFKGAQRRIQFIGEQRGIAVLDDYAHHPTEIKASLKAIKEHLPGRLFCLYQPHRFSRTMALLEQFGSAFCDCDRLLLASIYPGPGEEAMPGVDSLLIAESVERHAGTRPSHMESWDDLVDTVLREARAGDVIVTMGAGDIYNLGPRILDRLSSQ